MKALILTSGGVDSTTCLAIAIDKYGKENVSSLSVYYGQKHEKELECARKVSEYYDVKHYEIDLSSIMQFSNCSLLKKSSEDIEYGSYADQLNKSNNLPLDTYVPFRNGLFISAVTSLALSIYPNEQVNIYCGIHSDDSGSAYPDCSTEFNEAMREAVYYGSGKLVDLVSPLVKLKKKDVVKWGLELKVPFELTWSCYEGNDEACGKCATCIDRLKAFEANGVKDPIKYKGE